MSELTRAVATFRNSKTRKPVDIAAFDADTGTLPEDGRGGLNTAGTKEPSSRGKPGKKAKKTFRIRIETILSLGTVAAVFAAWYLITELKLVNDVLVPKPAQVWKAFVDILQNGYKDYPLARHLADSLWRLLSAFGLVIVTAIPLGLVSGLSSKVRAIVEPLIEFYRPLPPLAYYTLLVLWMGIEDSSKIALLYLAGFAPVYIACVAGVAKIKPDYLNCARTLGAGKLRLFTHVVFPASLPDIFIGLRTALGVSYTTLVAAEMVAAVTGIGWMVLDASKFLRSDVIFLGIIIMGFSGILLDRLVRLVERIAVPYTRKTGEKRRRA